MAGEAEELVGVPVDFVLYVRFGIKSNHDLGTSYLDGSSPFVGLSKVSFFGREEIAGVRVTSVSSRTALDPAADAELGFLHQRAEVRSDRDNNSYLGAWTPGTYVLRDSRGLSRTVSVAAVPLPVEVAGPWQVSFPRGWGTPEHATFEKLASWPAIGLSTALVLGSHTQSHNAIRCDLGTLPFGLSSKRTWQKHDAGHSREVRHTKSRLLNCTAR